MSEDTDFERLHQETLAADAERKRTRANMIGVASIFTVPAAGTFVLGYEWEALRPAMAGASVLALGFITVGHAIMTWVRLGWK